GPHVVPGFKREVYEFRGAKWERWRPKAPGDAPPRLQDPNDERPSPLMDPPGRQPEQFGVPCGLEPPWTVKTRVSMIWDSKAKQRQYSLISFHKNRFFFTE